VSYATAVQSASISAGPWGAVVGSTTGTSSVLGSSITGEGWWNGAAWVDVEVEDHMTSNPVRFTIPLVAVPTPNFFLRSVEWFTDRAQRILFDSQLLLSRGGWNEGWHVILVDLDNNFWAGANVKSGGDKELVRSAAQKYSRKNSASSIF